MPVTVRNHDKVNCIITEISTDSKTAKNYGEGTENESSDKEVAQQLVVDSSFSSSSSFPSKELATLISEQKATDLQEGW